jgi:hypothetical protein
MSAPAPAPKRKTAVEKTADKVSEAKQAALLKHTKQQIKDMQLSLFDLAPWPTHAGMPNDFGRSAIFTTGTRRCRAPRCRPVDLPRQQGRGDHLHRDRAARRRRRAGIGPGAGVREAHRRSVRRFPSRSTSFARTWLVDQRPVLHKAEECLTRLQASAMQFSSQRIGRLESVSLIRRFRVLDRGKRTSRCQVEIDAEMVVLFAGDHYTKFVWEKYRKLSPTARRMFDYFATHKEPYPLEAGDVPADVRLGFGPAEEVARAGRRGVRRAARKRPGQAVMGAG